MISLLGLFLMGVSYMMGVAVAAIIAVLVVMAASVTLLPSLLAFAGRRVDRLRIPGLGRTLRTDRPGRRPSAGPGPCSGARGRRRSPATAVLLALAAPALGLRLGFPDAGNRPADSTTRQAYDLISEGFGPGANGPLLVDGRPGATRLGGRPAASCERRLRAEDGVAFVVPPRLSPAGDAAILDGDPGDRSPQDAATQELVDRLRGRRCPPSRRAGVPVLRRRHHGGLRRPERAGRPTGCRSSSPGSWGCRSCSCWSPSGRRVMALKAGLMNLLSVGAAYGVVALVAEGGWAGRPARHRRGDAGRRPSSR